MQEDCKLYEKTWSSLGNNTVITGISNLTKDIVEELGGNVIACACIMNLTFLPGSSIIKNRKIPFYAGVEY